MDGSYLFVATMSHHNGLSMRGHPPILLEGILQARWCTCEALPFSPQASMSQSSGNTSKCHEIPFETLNFSPRGCAPHPAETAGAAPRTPIPSPSCMRGPEGPSPPRGQACERVQPPTACPPRKLLTHMSMWCMRTCSGHPSSSRMCLHIAPSRMRSCECPCN